MNITNPHVGSSVGSSALAANNFRSAVPCPAYRSCVPGKGVLGTGNFKDISGRGSDIFIPSSHTEAAARVNGRMVSVAGTGKAFFIPNAQAKFDPATESILIMFRINKATPAAAENLITLGPNSNEGLYFLVNTGTGYIRPILKTTGTILNGLPDLGPFADGTDHLYCFALDPVTKAIYQWIDSQLVFSGRNLFTGTFATPTGNLNIGANFGAIATATSYDAKFDEWHYLKWTGALPLNVNQIASRFPESLGRSLAAGEVLSFTKRKLVGLALAQSNEEGFGSGYSGATDTTLGRDLNAGLGAPLKDPIAPNGTIGNGRSWWPRFARGMGNLGIWADVSNTAQNGTSATDSWMGRIRNWSSGMGVVRGSYALSNGSLWRCSIGAGLVGTSTVAPTGTADMAAGADSVPWAYLGALGPADVPGVLGSTHARFDPNGYVATAVTQLNAGVGYDEKWMFLSCGQTDALISTPRADYAQAITNATTYFISLGFKVAIGFTTHSTVAGLEAWYQSNLLPGYADALAAFASNPNVVAGANLRAAVGVLTNAPAAGAPGLQSDGLHINAVASDSSGDAWTTALTGTAFAS